MFLSLALPCLAQDIEPLRWSHLPLGSNFGGVAYAYTAAKIRIPTLAILGKPGPGNANRNATAMLAAIHGCKTVEIPIAVHFDFEARPSTLCHRLTGSTPDAARTAAIHETMLVNATRFLQNPPARQP